MPAEPWTRRLYVPWDVPVAFYESRWQVLTTLEETARLTEHRVTDGRIAVRLNDAYHVMSFADDYFDAALLKPDGDLDVLQEAITLLFDVVRPKTLLRPMFDFQWLVPLSRSYNQARTGSALAAFGDAGRTVEDWSATIDGRLSEPAATYRAEFGIVDSSETPPRLARAISSFVSPPDPDVPPSVWPRSTLPEVAWFFDSRVEVTDRVENPSVEALLDLWSLVSTPISEVEAAFRQSFRVEEDVEQRSS